MNREVPGFMELMDRRYFNMNIFTRAITTTDLIKS